MAATGASTDNRLGSFVPVFMGGLGDAAFEAVPQAVSIEIAADEDELARTQLVRLPWPPGRTVDQHMDRLIDMSLRTTGEIEDALAAQDIDAFDPQQRADPSLKFIAVERPAQDE
jgi:hypothetical protein